MIRFIIKPLFILLVIIVPVFSQDVCPPNNLTVTPGVGTLDVSWTNPGFYYGTHEVSPQSANYHTGSVTVATGFTETSRIKGIADEHGWAMFDISSLPPGLEPLTVEFNFYVYETNYPYWSVTPVSSNPLTTGSTPLYVDIVEGSGSDGVNDYGSFYESDEFSAGQYSYQLVGSVFEDIASASDIQDWFTIGIVGFDFVYEYFILLEGWAEPHPPSLTITYGEGERYIVPAIPYPGADAADIAEYKEAVSNGLQEEVETEHAQVYVEIDRTNDRDCLGANAYYLFMDGDTLLYTTRNDYEVQGNIGQEYCFYLTSEVDVPDSAIVFSSDTTQVTNSDLFFSEYAEGSSYNKYLEIYNGTGADVDLSAYSISTCSNGCNDTTSAGLYTWDYPNNMTFSAGTVIADGDVYVINHGSASSDIVAQGDTTFTYLSNGDDVMALTVAGATDSVFTIIDIIGEMGPDPGSGWDVAGVTNATKDHTLVRKSTITGGNTNWTTSAGTNTTDSEWIVYDQNTWSYLGSHTMYVVTLDTTYDITWHTEYSAPSETVCGSPVEFLLCSTTDFHNVSSYTELNLDWTAPFRPNNVAAWGWFYGGSNQTIPNIESVTKISAGYSHGLFLRSDSTVFNWPTGGYLDIPGNANHDFIDIAAGWFFNIGLRSDGTMYGWWYSEEGQGEPPDSVTDAVAVAGGFSHAMALRSDSTVVAWGYNDYGATDVPAGLNNVIQIDAGNNYSAALKSDGTVVAWGNNTNGETTVPGDLTDVVEIACGSNHMLALKSDGSIVAWGSNGNGQTEIPANLGEVEKIAAGGYHNMVLNTNGELIGWGYNNNGQTDLPEVFENVTQIACGEWFTAVLLADAGEDCGTLNGYTVYEGGDSIAFTTEPNYTVTTLEWGEEACYNIAVNYDQGYSTWTDTICGSLITPTFCNTDTLAAESSYDEIELFWPSREGLYCGTLIGYCVYQDGVPIDTLDGITYTISDADYDVDYCYYVTSLYEEGESVATDTVCISLVTPQLCLVDSTSAEPGDNEVTVSWQEPYIFSRNRANSQTATRTNVTPLSITRKQEQGGNLEEIQLSIPSLRSRDENCGTFLGYTVYQDGDSIAFVSDSSTSFIATGLDNGMEYCFSVTALYNQGLSANTEEVCAIPFAVLRDHNTGIVQTSITNEGNIGFTDWAWIDDSTAGNGLGFVFAGNNYLFEGGLMVGTSQNQISDCIRNELGGFEEDFVEEEGTYLHIDTTGDITHEEGLVLLNDSGADNPLGIHIVQKSYADLQFETRNGILFHYTLVNENNTDLTGLYAGLFFDWDMDDSTMGMDYLMNSAYYNADHQMVYVQDQEANPSHFAGTMLLNVGLGANIDALYNDGDGVYQYSNQLKWMHMNGGVKDEPAFNADVSTYTGIGPVDIAAGDSISFGIAVLAASSVYELEYVAGELRNFWDTHFPEELGNENEATLPDVFALHQNYPNPFNPVTSIRYDIPEAANVQVSIYSLLGQKVKTLASGAHQPGFYAVQWNGTNDHGNPVASGMYICRIQADRFNAVKKLILMK